MMRRSVHSLAIFTEPLSGRARLHHVKTLIAWIFSNRNSPRPLLIGGHYAVSRSLFAGLRRLGVSFAYNPDLSATPADAAIVLSSTDSLKKLCAWKKAGRCRKLLAGPNLVVRPGDAGGVLLSPEIDQVVVPSAWVRDLYITDGPIDPGRVAIWAAGVDETWWVPQADKPKTDILIYDKDMPDMAAKVAKMVAALGMQHKILRYGDYSTEDYRAALDQAAACIVLTESESQGLSLAEAWAMDVPTLVIDQRTRLINGLLTATSTAPYLGSQTGDLWQNEEELRNHLLRLPSAGYSPRKWVLENMTDAVCAREFLALALNGDSRK